MRTTIAKITNAYIRTYTDSGQTTAYVEWIDTAGKPGRTEGKEHNAHMGALLARATRGYWSSFDLDFLLARAGWHGIC